MNGTDEYPSISRSTLSNNLRRNGGAFASLGINSPIPQSPRLSMEFSPTSTKAQSPLFPQNEFESFPSSPRSPRSLRASRPAPPVPQRAQAHTSPLNLQERNNSIPVIIPSAFPEEPMTPCMDPEIPPEIPQISNLRGGRGLMQRLPTNAPITPPAGSVQTENPYATPDPTPQKQVPVIDHSKRLSATMLSMRTTCAICLDDNLLTLNGTLLECGNYVHRACLMTAQMSLQGANMAAVCGICGMDCVAKGDGSAECSPTSSTSSFYLPEAQPSSAVSSARSAETSSPTSAASTSPTSVSSSTRSSTNSAVSVGSVIRGGIGEELKESDLDVEPLRVKAFIHRVGDTRCELAVRVACNPAGQRSLWRHEHARMDSKRLLRLGYEMLNLTPINHKSLEEKESFCGQLRLVSKFSDSKRKPFYGYLFENCCVFAGITQQGVKYFYQFFDLREDGLNVFVTKDKIHFVNEGNDAGENLVLYGERKTLATWMSAINDKKHDFVYNPVSPKDPLVEGLLPSPFSTGFVESNNVEAVLCVPYDLVESAVASIRSEMNPQDRLGLVIVSEDGSLKRIPPHKMFWSGWDQILVGKLDLAEFETSDLPLTAAAEEMLNPSFCSKQQTVIVAASSGSEADLECTSSSKVNHYVVGCSSEFSLLPQAIIPGTQRRFRHYHASSKFEVVDIVKGIYLSERHYRHECIKIKIEPFSPANVRRIEARGPQRASPAREYGYEVQIGSILAGQYKTVLFDIELGELSCLMQLRDLVHCQVTSSSTFSHSPYVQEHVYVQEVFNSHSPQFFFDTLVRRLSEKVLSLQPMQGRVIKHELELLSDETIEQVQKAVTSFEKGGTARLSYVGEYVLDFDPIFSNKAMSTRAKHLAWGFCQLEHDLQRLPSTGPALTYKLVELLQTLDTHHSVICRNDLERIFFESLPNNKI